MYASEDQAEYRISTHALREEGDQPQARGRTSSCRFLPTPSARRATWSDAERDAKDRDFYPRPPRGGRQNAAAQAAASAEFLPTPSARRATARFLQTADLPMISTHALREEGDTETGKSHWSWAISTHALREEGDNDVGEHIRIERNFYPRPPRGGRPGEQVTVGVGLEFLPTPSARRATRRRRRS